MYSCVKVELGSRAGDLKQMLIDLLDDPHEIRRICIMGRNCTLDRLSDNMTYAWVFAWSGNFLNLCILGFLMITCCEYHVLIYCRRCFVHWTAKEIRDSRLRTHILTTMKNMMSLRRKASGNIPSESSDSSFATVDGNNSMELFCILGVCEKQKKLGRHSWLKQNKCSGLCLPWLLHGFQM